MLNVAAEPLAVAPRLLMHAIVQRLHDPERRPALGSDATPVAKVAFVSKPGRLVSAESCCWDVPKVPRFQWRR